MAVAADGELCGSIGGGVMEVELAELAKVKSKKAKGKIGCELIEQVHRKNVPNSSGMICSGRQTVIVKDLGQGDLETVLRIIESLKDREPRSFEISDARFQVIETTRDNSPFYFSKTEETEFVYQERLGYKHNLFIIGGGHCALALSELMSRLGFCISIFDDRPDLNTLDKNAFAHEISIIDSYETIADFVPSGDDNYVVVMTIGYAFDEVVIRKLFEKDYKYFGVLGSKAKMKMLLTKLEKEGFDKAKLKQIHTPIGLPINSHTPEEIAVSIAAEIIAVKNS
jgi:xanthine dehydrogenase accessory factor